MIVTIDIFGSNPVQVNGPQSKVINTSNIVNFTYPSLSLEECM
jgi:hypothetical protein